MNVAFSPNAWEDFLWWLSANNNGTQKVLKLINEIRRTPFKGTGKPEALKNELHGFWSRRIDQEHRIVYRVDGKGTEQRLQIAQLRYHY